jgi:hypothetical protein
MEPKPSPDGWLEHNAGYHVLPGKGCVWRIGNSFERRWLAIPLYNAHLDAYYHTLAEAKQFIEDQ